ncbi:RNA polymerase sigma factor [Dethiobacter alkaliphilus]|uniref:RNA polymerase sigma factor n=1 Tax=Dethiobacter alkaliphilus AHT 1 TaxID=555088 RepID=C0GIR4_DETAL|nr:sigma-70 family RNA polymerase sigma factor [Dethiobacter alkaliphilus]EEG76728.1 RNA polymerase, sigma-24 subunit, ECF subfamily [Dethiobacter alkaliphilus AHT 1]
MDIKEKELVARCQRGDLSAYDELMKCYEQKVYALCFRMSGNHTDAQDLAQEAFLKAFRALPSFKGQSQFSTWLYRIVTNTCLDERRRQARRPGLVSMDKPLDTDDGQIAVTLPDKGPDPLSEALNSELQAEIQELLSRLPAGQRIVVVMRDLEGYSYDEIAAVLDVNIGTVKSRLNRARARLRDLYLKKEEHFTPVVHLKGKGGLSHDL